MAIVRVHDINGNMRLSYVTRRDLVGAFNVAPDDQQVASLASGVRIAAQPRKPDSAPLHPAVGTGERR